MGTGPQPYTPVIQVTESINGVELYAPPRRSPMMPYITIFAIIWTAVVAGLIFIDSEIPLIAPILFGFFDIPILWLTLWMWFGKSYLTIEHSTVHINKTLFGKDSITTLNSSDITDVDMHIQEQSGTTPYYTIRLYTTSGTKNTVRGILNKDEVEDLIKLIKKTINV